MSGTQNRDGSGAASPAPPHPPLLSYYSSPDERSGFVQRTFDETAESYDRINSFLSFGSGAWYRRRALQAAGLRPGVRVVDLAIGTGLVAREALRIVGRADDVVGVDVSEGMLRVARRSLPIALVKARGEALPLADGCAGFVSMGYALRHVSDLALLFREIHRVLRPGGELVILEIGRPDTAAGYQLARAYFGRIVPALSRLAGSRSRTLMTYYWDTIDSCVPASEILQHLRGAGLEQVRCDTQLGVFRAYMAQRPAT